MIEGGGTSPTTPPSRDINQRIDEADAMDPPDAAHEKPPYCTRPARRPTRPRSTASATPSKNSSSHAADRKDSESSCVTHKSPTACHGPI